jgi:hypothetical protein
MRRDGVVPNPYVTIKYIKSDPCAWINLKIARGLDMIAVSRQRQQQARDVVVVPNPYVTILLMFLQTILQVWQFTSA